MAKQRKSLLRQEYEKEYKRIDRALLRLRKEGYDISALELPPKNPQRVTKGRLETLKAITPQWLRSALKEHRTNVIPEKGTPLRNKKGQFLSKQEIITEAERISKRNARKQAEQAELERRRKETEKWITAVEEAEYTEPEEPLPFVPETVEEYTPTYTDETDYYEEPWDDTVKEYLDREWKQEEPEDWEKYKDEQLPEQFRPSEPEEPTVDTYAVIEDNVIKYLDIVTGELIDTSPLGVDITGDTITYYDALTGNIIKEEPNNYGETTYDVSSYVMEYLEALFDRFSYATKDKFHNLMDIIIGRVGKDTFIQSLLTVEDGRTLLEMIEASGFDYDEIVRTFSLAVERMDIPEETKDELREIIYEHSGFFEEV